MPHSSRIMVYTHQGYRSFASRSKCNALESAQKGSWQADGSFRMFPPEQWPDGIHGEWRAKATDSGETLKFHTGPQFKTVQFDRAR